MFDRTARREYNDPELGTRFRLLAVNAKPYGLKIALEPYSGENRLWMLSLSNLAADEGRSPVHSR